MAVLDSNVGAGVNRNSDTHAGRIVDDRVASTIKRDVISNNLEFAIVILRQDGVFRDLHGAGGLGISRCEGY